MSNIEWPNLPSPSADIYIIGLGAGELTDMSLASWHALQNAQVVLLRTERHPSASQLQQYIEYTSLDYLYEAHDEFADVYAEIVDQVVARSQEIRAAATQDESRTDKKGGVAYVVPGHPWVGEMTTRLVLEQAQKAGLRVVVLGSTSFIEPSFAAVGIDPMDGSQVVDGMLIAQQHHPQIEPTLPLLVGQIYANWLASDIKLTLLNAYPAEHQVTLVHAAGGPEERVRTIALHALDHESDFDHLTTLYVPPLDAYGSFSALQEIVAHLRAPEGCPWDQEQTLQTLRHDLLSECAEVIEAIDIEADGSDNTEHIAEELGDLLLTPAMMIQIAAEEGRFQVADVTRGIVKKLIRRHPHVFAETSVSGVEEVFATWDEIKAQERAEKGAIPRGPLDGVPAALPALEKARELQSKAAKADLMDRAKVAQSVSEKLAALNGDASEETLGALLWSVVALAKQMDLNAEDALRAYSVRFRSKHTIY